jgi:ORF6N domain
VLNFGLATANDIETTWAHPMSRIIAKPENLAPLIFLIRGERVLLSQHLAELYGVSVSALNQAVKRNIKRFPDDFMFQLSEQEFEGLKSQIVISNRGGLRRALPYAFTEQGVAMLSSVLRSPRAVEVNIAIMRTFVQLRRLMDSNRELARKIEAMEKKYDEQFAIVFDAIKQLIADDQAERATQRQIGFHP